MTLPNGHGHNNGHPNGSSNGNENGGFAWRATKPYLAVDDGASTESEAESSYKGWSDNGWWVQHSRRLLLRADGSCRVSRRDSPNSTHARASLSSGDERAPPYEPLPNSSSVPRIIAFTPHVPLPENGSHRRHTITRQGHRSSASLETGSAQNGGASTVLDFLETASPLNFTPTPVANGFEVHQSYPRARRKSLSHTSPAIPPPESDDDSPLNGTPHGKAKKKRRTASFSLPFHRRRRLSNASYWRLWNRKGPNLLRRLGYLLILLLVLLYGIILWRRRYKLHFEFSVKSHRRTKRQYATPQPLRGCFDPHNVSPDYNVPLNLAPKRQLLTPGFALRRGMSCYEFSSTVQPIPGVPLEPLTYHTYWRSDLIPFGERHTATLTSFLATQPLTHSKLILWSNGAELVANNAFIRPYLDKWGDNIEVRQIDMNALTRGTELAGLLSGMNEGGLFDERAWVDGDAVRLLVLWHFGGVWMDMDQILTRDLHPLTESEFVTQWDCEGEPIAPSRFHLGCGYGK